jgi:hypothetical protein
VVSIELSTEPDPIIGTSKDTTEIRFLEREPKLMCGKEGYRYRLILARIGRRLCFTDR